MSQSRSTALASLPGSSKWKELAMATIEASSRCEVGAERGFKPTPRFTAAMANMRMEDIQPVVRATQAAKGGFGSALPYLGKGDDEPGIFKPLGFWDPWGLSTEATDGQIAYFREAELKHGRICMLSSLGIVAGESGFRPLWGGDIDVNAVQTATKVSPTIFWPAIIAVLGAIEVSTSSGRADEFANSDVGLQSERADIARNGKELKPGLIPGDLGFDPLNLRAQFSDEEFVGIQNRELAHCRLAMIAVFGMLSQELAFPDVKLYPFER